MAQLTKRRGLAAVAGAGGFGEAAYVMKRGHRYPSARGRIAETYRQLANGPMTGTELFADLASRNWKLPRAGRPFRRAEFHAHLKWMVDAGRLHVLSGKADTESQAVAQPATDSKPKGLAFKVTYNDGGASGGLIGYRGVCSDRIMVQNVEVDRRTWCSDPGNDCRRFCDRGRTGARPKAPCYESELLSRRPIRFWTGTYHSGPRSGEPILIDFKKVAAGDVVLLTTVPPGRPEGERIVFACYRVGRVGTDEWGHFVESDGTMELVMPEDVAIDCRYWDYQPRNRDGSVFWGSGLFRYVTRETTQHFVEDLVYRLGDSSERDVLVRALGGTVTVKRPQGGPGGAIRGSGGEGEEHRRLKELVAAKPKLIGLPARAKATVEHRFLSGDQVDVKFDLPNGDAAVVEVETTLPLPGAHQAVKYRALLEVERGVELGSGCVEAVLVAHAFNAEARQLADRYGIRLVELKA